MSTGVTNASIATWCKGIAIKGKCSMGQFFSFKMLLIKKNEVLSL